MLSIFDIIIRYKEALLKGLFVTVQLCAVIWILGIIFGALIGYFGAKFRKGVGIPSRVISFFLAGIPILVLLFWLYYPGETLLQINIDPFYVAAFAISIVNIFLVADLTRNALINFPNEYKLAAKVCGLSQEDTFFKIELPIIMRQILPSLLGIQVNMLQLTLFASLITVGEIFRVAQQINAQIYEPVQIYSALALLFLVICLPLNGLAEWLKHKFTRDISEI
jgi:His/Glu/Gln/Arg/opine family amino acid ABC transporter permease subunit